MFKKTALDSGLRVLTAPMQGTNTVTVLVMCATGSDYEVKSENGISHFLEHMFFKGTTNRPTPEHIRHELDGMGSISNAFTDHETTGYYIKAGKLHATKALEILSDIYRNSLLTEEEIEREKQVVVEEMHLRRDEPTTHIWQLWERLLYGDQPAGCDISGEEAIVRQFRREDLARYFTHQYVAGNTAVVVAGNMDEGAITARIRELFSDIRHESPRVKPTLTEVQPSPQLSGEERKTDQTHCVIGFRGYDVFHAQRYAADLLAVVLGGSWSSRMFSRIREKLGLAYSVSSDHANYSNRGFLVTYAGVAHENAERAARAILEEYRRIREELVPGGELTRTKDLLKGRMLMALETSNAVASFVGGEEMLTGKPLTIEEVFAKVDGVRAEDIQAVAREIVRPERLNAVLLGPAPHTPALESLIKSFS
ncbi:MAG: insulinase family protein [Candidatus Sungbacteria bacterium]|uniref:Insulinase family protein n=1 Tax=Candidatus Sungiibacteriota bacterium TaxID=2750080 RepID=A0A933DRU6_9BACT|nr:insulinase family protein [Candidatus Sungbacteria bacterium]